jgi:DNA end-binding protein Ku
VLLRPYAQGLIMQQLRYPDEIRAFSEVPVGDAEVKPAELSLALQLIDQIAADRFKPEAYEDAQKQRVWELIERKIEGQDIVAAPEEAPKAQIIDLMEALKASLGEDADKKPARRSERKPASTKKKAKKAAEG